MLIVLPYLAVIEQTAQEYEKVFEGHVEQGELISFTVCPTAPTR